MIREEITCPACGGESVNMTDNPVMTHVPKQHNWWGQAHIISAPMTCECGHSFSIVVTAYKSRASVEVNSKVDEASRDAVVSSRSCTGCGREIKSIDTGGKCESCFYFPRVKP